MRSNLRNELNTRTRINAISSLVIPVVTNSFTVINWSLTEIKKVDTKIRKLLSMYRMRPPKSDVNRLYLPRKEGSRGLVQLELSLQGFFFYKNVSCESRHVFKQHNRLDARACKKTRGK